MLPHRRILLCATGMSPQIVTETLYALAMGQGQTAAPWIPDEIHVISTHTGIQQAQRNLLSKDPGWFKRLCEDCHLPPIEFGPPQLHAISDAKGQLLEDIRTPEDNDAAADSIAEQVRALTADPDSELHVSLAGGRKTMGYFLGYALSLYGRPQDQLSHVLVTEGYEGHPDFYYPTPYEKIIHQRGDPQRALDCAEAQVSLATIPFVRLRDGLPTRLLQGKARFTETVAIANQAQNPAHLHLDPSTRSVWVNESPVTLTDTHFALLYWFAKRHEEGRGEVHLNQEYAEFLALLVTLFDQERRLSASLIHGAAAFEHALSTVQPTLDLPAAIHGVIDSLLDRPSTKPAYEYFKSPISRLHSELQAQLGERLAERLRIRKPKNIATAGYSLPGELQVEIDHC